MLNPNSFYKKSAPQSKPSMGTGVALEQIAGLNTTRWDEPIQVPDILYQKFQVQRPRHMQNKVSSTSISEYPSSLMDYIKRAYSRCKTEEQSKAMQVEIRQIISKNDVHSNNWQHIPLPEVPGSVQTMQLHNYVSNNHPNSYSDPRRGIHKESVTIPRSSNRSIIDNLQKEDKKMHDSVKEKLEKSLQRFSQKIENRDNEKAQEPLKKSFIGFQDEKEVKIQQLREEYERKAREAKEREERAKRQQQKVQLQVIESRIPSPVRVKDLKRTVDTSSKPASGKKITKKDAKIIAEASDNKEEFDAMAKRMAQFSKFKPQKRGKQTIEQEDPDIDQDLDFKIVGKCKKIDKPFLRITQRPDPQTVRPEPILRKAFNHYKNEYKKGGSYDTIIWQFRSIRQDLTVQDIRNSFTVQVYEENLRMSLFEDDVLQLKQCQTNLWELYREGLYNKRSDRAKYISYHFMTMILQERYKELEYMLTLLPGDTFQAPEVQTSLKLKRYLVIGNYKAIFDFFAEQETTVQKLMNHYMDKVRVKCLLMACKTFGDKVTFEILAKNTGQDEDILELLSKEEGAVISNGHLMLKESIEHFRNSEHLQVKKVSSLMG